MIYDPEDFLSCLFVAAIIVLGITASGCAAGAANDPTYPLTTPGGHQGYAVECQYPADCWQWAGIKCPRGYEVISGSKESGFSFSANGYGASGGSRHLTTMMVECREPATSGEATPWELERRR